MKNLESLTSQEGLFPLQTEREPPTKLFHVSGHQELMGKELGDSFVLTPGSQGAEGSGVYFSEGDPRFSAAEGARGKATVVVVIEPNSKKGWWQSKGYVMRKFDRPRTWHSEGKNIRCVVTRVEDLAGTKYLFCDWEWTQAGE